MDRGAWRAIVMGSQKELDTTECLNNNYMYIYILTHTYIYIHKYIYACFLLQDPIQNHTLDLVVMPFRLH